MQYLIIVAYSLVELSALQSMQRSNHRPSARYGRKAARETWREPNRTVSAVSSQCLSAHSMVTDNTHAIVRHIANSGSVRPCCRLVGAAVAVATRNSTQPRGVCGARPGRVRAGEVNMPRGAYSFGAPCPLKG